MSYSNRSSNLKPALKYYDTPLCLVGGFMSSPNMDMFQNVIIQLKQTLRSSNQPCPTIIKSLGCGAVSCYDNAIDLFYQLKGGTVDYGETHSKKHFHGRFSTFYEKGQYEEWSEDNPINFLTHSLGGNIVLLLQTLLDQKVFYNAEGKKYDTNANWVRSLTTISSPLRGTLCSYHLGHHPHKPHLLTPFTFKKMIYFGCYVWEYFDLQFLKHYSFLDFKASHFNISYRDINFLGLLKNIFSNQGLDLGLDTASYDISIERYLYKPTKTFNKTYYKSYAATMTEPIDNSDDDNLTSIQHWCLYLVNIATKTGSTGLNIYPQLNQEDAFGWKSNDGMCSLISQLHPDSCSESHCQHTQLNETKRYIPGKWYTTTISNCSHVDLVPGFHPPSRLTNFILKLVNMLPFTRISTSDTFWNKEYLVEKLEDVVKDYTNFLAVTEHI